MSFDLDSQMRSISELTEQEIQSVIDGANDATKYEFQRQFRKKGGETGNHTWEKTSADAVRRTLRVVASSPHQALSDETFPDFRLCVITVSRLVEVPQ